MEPLRFTPAGIPVVNFRLAHSSSQIEAGIGRLVQSEITAIAVGQLAEQISKRRPEQECMVRGFIAARSRNSSQIVLHVNEIRF